MNAFDPAVFLALAVITSILVAIFAVCLFWRVRHERQRNSVLEESLAAFRMMFDSNPNPMYVYDVDTCKLLAVNQTLCEHFGYTPDDLVGGSLMALHIEPEREELRKVVMALRESRDPNFRRRWLLLKKSGDAVPVEIVSRPLRQDGSNARLVVAIDISEKLRAEEEVANQRQLRESLLETLPVPVFYKDRAGHYLGVNQAFVKLLGQNREFFIGRTAWDIAPKELAAIYDAADESLYANPGVVQTYSAQVNSSAWGKRDVVFHKAVFNDSSGKAGGLIGTVIDVTDQLASEQAVRESESRLAQILHNSPLPMFVIDANHRLLVWNPACERTFGVPAAEVLGTNRQWSAFYPSERPCMADIVLEGGMEKDVDHYYHGRYRRSQLNPEAFEAEDFFPSMGDGGRWLYFTASPLRDAHGQIVGAIETLLDISERKRAEHEVQQLNEGLEAKIGERTDALARANEELRLAMKQLVQTEKLASLGSLVAGIAHELNTPLGNVLTVTTTLRARTDDFSELINSGEALRRSSITNFMQGCVDAAAIIERNATRAADLIGSFKEVAVDQTSMRRREFDLGEVIGEILSALQPTLRRTPHTIKVEVPSDIKLDSYPGPLEQVLSNLIMNSLLHGFEHTPEGIIHIQATASENQILLRYTDNGSGMNELVCQQAFDPFFTTKLGKGGSGLGLYIVYNLVTAVLGGSISLHSKPDAGVVFELVLPRNAPRLAEHEEVA